ncbi:MAG TPA: dephospho-CoA kinase [Gammaproteobacteria bacterium]|nr:dephospho-CoA kinase [Gammaproteobacteria bacterium]
MLRVALTGGIASGKSTAAARFRELGVPVIDTDRIARDVVEPGAPGLDALVGHFGEDILDDAGRLDRATLRARIFSHPEDRRQVDALLHPLILEQLERELATLETPYAIIEIPLLAEGGFASRFDRVLVIDVPEETQIARLMARDGSTREQAEQALAAQASREARLKVATDVIVNDAGIDALHDAVTRQHERYLELAGPFAGPAHRPSE